MLAFIDQIAIPFLEQLYGAVGYVGVMIAMAIESAMIPLPSELILPFAGFLVSDPHAIEPLTGQPWSYWLVVVFGTAGNTLGSLIAYAIGAWGGRPFLERYGKYMLIREHEIEVADRFFEQWGSPTVFFSRLLPIVRTFISFPAGVARMNPVKFVVYSTAGAFLWSMLLVWSGVLLGENWEDIRRILQPFDLAILVGVVVLVALFVWWRLGTPGWKRGGDGAVDPARAIDPARAATAEPSRTAEALDGAAPARGMEPQRTAEAGYALEPGSGMEPRRTAEAGYALEPGSGMEPRRTADPEPDA